MRWWLLPLLWLIVGCGGGGFRATDGEASLIEREVAPYESNPLLYEQWYFMPDRRFYNAYGIDPDAHIHPYPTPLLTGQGVRVVVIDDALDVYHEDLQGAVFATYDVQSESMDVMPRSAYETHGTHVAGIIAASSNHLGISGIAPGVQLGFIRIPFDTSTSDSTILEAFDKALVWDADVISCSWGTGAVSDAVRAKIEEVVRKGRDGKGCVVVFAVGNGGFDQRGDPIGDDESSVAGVIGVGASNIYNTRAEYSNYGAALDLLAPGGEYIGITTLDLMGEAGEDRGNYLSASSPRAFMGTSASAPIVSAVAALMLEADPNLTAQEVTTLLESYADKIDTAHCHYDTNGHSDYCGYGKVNLFKTVQTIEGKR